MKPEDLRYAKTHEWVAVAEDEGGPVAIVGLSAFAVEALTDLVFIELPKVGSQAEIEQPFCEVESVKAVSDVYAPVSGEVVAVNDALPDSLETLSNDPFGEGWIAKIRISDPHQLDALLDYASYQAQCTQEWTPTPMPYLYNTPEDQREMLAAVGAESIEELLAPIPADVRFCGQLDLPPALTEIELEAHLGQLAQRNRHADQLACFLGGGIYDHFVPAAVDAIGSRSEFYTSYTPYQPEASQGNLQAMFEFQSLVARLTGMDVANSSLYDGASSTAEAILMALGPNHRPQSILVPDSLHPEYRQVADTYLKNLPAELVTLPCPDGLLTPDTLETALIQAKTQGVPAAAVILQQPNFFGLVEQAAELTRIAHQHQALAIAVFDPLSLGLLSRPGDYGADIAVAEGQSLGTPMSYGGPVLGILACSQALLRRMPGRIVGETVDRRGTKCYVLTLQTREQHIRRDKATSNVCTNQSLFAVRASVYLSLLGPEGLRETAQLCLNKAHYLAQQLCQHERFSLAMKGPFFKEFVIRDNENDVGRLLQQAQQAGYLAGIALGSWYPELSDCFLVAVTEKRTRSQLDGLAGVLTGHAAAHATA